MFQRISVTNRHRILLPLSGIFAERPEVDGDALGRAMFALQVVYLFAILNPFSFSSHTDNMPTNATTVRLDPKLKKAVMKLAEEDGFTLSDIIKMLLRFYVEGAVTVGVTRYPNSYAAMIKKEAKETMRLYRQGKVKGYASAKEMMDDILQR